MMSLFWSRLKARTCIPVASASLLAAADIQPETQSSGDRPRAIPVVGILDGSAAQSAEYALWRRFSRAMQAHQPGDVPVYGPNESARVLDDYMQELNRRETHSGEEFPARVLIVFDVARFRMLRKSDDDFGFGRHDAEKSLSPAQQFTELLKRGPSAGLHLLVWCDTNSNVMRWLGMPLLREFEMRILFPMSAADSSQLIDTPEAGRLGVHRALLHRSDLGTIEKFRPFGELSEDWWKLWQPDRIAAPTAEPADVAADVTPLQLEKAAPTDADDRPPTESCDNGKDGEFCDDIDRWPVT
ncbi:MAG: hypothetical protein WEB58_09270 [Planctomycetaceae bacterium]